MAGILQTTYQNLFFLYENDHTVETLYSTIPYTTIFYITRWTHGPQNLQRQIRT